MPLERKKIEKALPGKGFQLEERDHRYYHLYVNGKKTGIFTFVSTGTKYKMLGDPLVSNMAKELHLSKGNFLRLVECPLDGPGYLALLRESGVRV